MPAAGAVDCSAATKAAGSRRIGKPGTPGSRRTSSRSGRDSMAHLHLRALVGGSLQGADRRITSAGAHQLGVGAALQNTALFKIKDQIGLGRPEEVVRDKEG